MNQQPPTSIWRLVVIDTTSGIPLVAGTIGVVAALLGGAAVTGSIFLPGWGDPLNATLNACFVMCPLAAGAAALHAGSLRRSGVAELAVTAPDGRWRTLTIAAVASGLWSVAAYLCLTSVVLLTSDLDGPFSPTMLLLPLQGTTLVIAGTAIGVLAGATIPYVWMPPLTATLMFVALNYLDRTSGPLDRYSMTYAFVFYQNNLVPNGTLVAGAMMIAAGAGVAATAALRGLTSRRRAVPWIVVSVVLIVAGVATTQDAPAGDVAYRTGGSARCTTDSTVRLCVFSESAPQLAPMAAALARAREAAQPVFGNVPLEFSQPRVRSQMTDPAPVDVPPNVEKFGYLGRAVEAVVPSAACAALGAERQELLALVYERLQPGSVASESIRRMARQPQDQQIAWARPLLGRIQGCS